ncbi:hypothetical protein SeLEV6574_g03118 [Synchytrium endobioticum]|uniref:30S ribosomal protein S13 n=1 Tax=Synchytrium endobioticum TaxID=286115 RepID=A0A507D5C7_9FUNG|nr:hypothetical protein SeLEV6574_g03118 [Synchytrium endobioticum]
MQISTYKECQATMYLLGINLPDAKVVRIALSRIHGIGVSTANQLCDELAIHPSCKLQDLREDQVNALTSKLSEMKIEQELRRESRARIQHLVDIGCYRGYRHKNNFPVNGQRTRSNAKTAKKLNGSFIKKEYASFSTWVVGSGSASIAPASIPRPTPVAALSIAYNGAMVRSVWTLCRNVARKLV